MVRDWGQVVSVSRCSQSGVELGSGSRRLGGAAGDVVDEVAGAEGGAAWVLKAAIDGFGGGIGPAGRAKYVRMSSAWRCGARSSLRISTGAAGGTAADAVDQGLRGLLRLGVLRGAVRGDHGLVDGPGHLALGVPGRREGGVQEAFCLLVSKSLPVSRARRPGTKAPRTSRGARGWPAGRGGGCRPARRRRA